MPAKDPAEYMRQYREAKKEDQPKRGSVSPGKRPAIESVDKTGGIPIVSEEQLTDRERGLPRSNYADAQAMGEAIQRADPKRIDRILNHPAIKTQRRER